MIHGECNSSPIMNPIPASYFRMAKDKTDASFSSLSPQSSDLGPSACKNPFSTETAFTKLATYNRQHDSTHSVRTTTHLIEINPRVALDIEQKVFKPAALRQSIEILAAVGVSDVVNGSGINGFVEADSFVWLWQMGVCVSPDL